MKRVLIPFFVLAFLFVNNYAQSRFTVDDLMKIRRVGDPQVSPNGKTVAYTIGDVNVTANRTITQIYTIPTTGGTAAQITNGDKSNSSPRWSPDGKRLAFTTGGQIWTMNSDGSDKKQVTTISTGAGNPVWSPDGKLIAFNSDVYPECNGDDSCNKAEDEKVENSKVQAKVTERLLYRHWTEWRDRKRTHVFVVSSEGIGAKQITQGDWDSPPYAASTGVDYAFSPDSKEIAFLRNPNKVEAISTNSDIYVVSLAGGTVKNITENNRGYDVAPTYSSDGKYIIYRSQAMGGFEADRWRIMRYNRQTGEVVELTQGFDLQVDELTTSPDSKTIYFTAAQRGLAPIYSVPIEPDFKLRITSHVKTLIAEGFNSNLNITADGKTLVYSSSSMTMPNEIFTVEAKQNAKPTKLSVGNPELSFLQKPEELEWKGASNKTIHGFITKPANFDASKKYPLLVLIHGGPQSAWNNSWGYRWNPQIFANQGYVVFQPNPRGSIGYGQRFVNEISADWGGKVTTDILNGVAQVIKKPYIDKENIGATGASYGG
ncbi:MAG: prolyl oligopeptidase family serine peptidase, partial [Acidobacteriota bacterium]